MKWFRNPFKSKKEDSVVKVTDSGRAYIDTDDFFKQEEIIKTIQELVKSDLIKQIDNYNQNRLKIDSKKQQQLITE